MCLLCLWFGGSFGSSLLWQRNIFGYYKKPGRHGSCLFHKCLGSKQKCSARGRRQPQCVAWKSWWKKRCHVFKSCPMSQQLLTNPRLGELPDHVDAQTHWIKFWFIIVFIGPINTFDVLKPVLTPGTLAQHESTGNAVLYSALSRQQDRDLAWRIRWDCLNQNPSEASRPTPSALKHEVKTRNERCCWPLTLQILGFCHFQDLCLPLSMIPINTSPPKAILEDGYNGDVAQIKTESCKLFL